LGEDLEAKYPTKKRRRGRIKRRKKDDSLYNLTGEAEKKKKVSSSLSEVRAITQQETQRLKKEEGIEGKTGCAVG